MIPGRLLASDLTQGRVVTTLSDVSTLTVDLEQSPGDIVLAVTAASTSHGKLMKTDILAAHDVVIHVIDVVRVGSVIQ